VIWLIGARSASARQGESARLASGTGSIGSPASLVLRQRLRSARRLLFDDPVVACSSSGSSSWTPFCQRRPDDISYRGRQVCAAGIAGSVPARYVRGRTCSWHGWRGSAAGANGKPPPLPRTDVRVSRTHGRRLRLPHDR
jgi:hypothetical protein